MKHRILNLALLAMFSLEAFAILFIAIISFVGCSQTKYVADYDATTDLFLTNAEQKIDHYLIQKQAGAAYSSDFYSDIAADFSTALTRARSIENDSLTVHIIGDLQDQVTATKRIDSLGYGSTLFYETVQSTVDSDFQAAIKFELEKKRLPADGGAQ